VTRLLTADDLRCRIDSCPAGADGWVMYEQLCVDILSYLFVPPLRPPRVQARTLSGTERRDAVFANRQRDTTSNWGLLYADHGARMILVEFKNYDSSDVGPEEVAEASGHLRREWGSLAIICSSKQPTPAAYRRRNTLYAQDGKLILFLTSENLTEMLDIKDRGEDPSDLIVDLIEEFLIQYE
jgi:hypothetical protein